MQHYPLDPIPTSAGAVLPLSGGRVIWQLNELRPDASEPDYIAYNRYIAILRDMGHVVVVGGIADVALALTKDDHA